MKLEPRDRFYMVWRKGTATIRFQHPAYGSAVDEAKRLAKEVPKEEFYVLAALNMFAHIDMETSISLNELVNLPDTVIAQLSKDLQKKIIDFRKKLIDWNTLEILECDCGMNMIVHKVGCPLR